MLRSDLCYFSDAYIVAKGAITFTKTRGIIYIKNRFLAFKNNATFANCCLISIMSYMTMQKIQML